MARRRVAGTLASTAVLAGAAPFVSPAAADEGGVSFWLPGQMGSFSAVPSDPGFSLPLVYYHTTADAAADKPFPRGGRTTLGVDATGDLVFAFPTYVFKQPLLGAQASAGVGFGGGHLKVSVDATVTGPLGNTISGAESDGLDGVADLYPTASLKWHHDVHNWMAYTMLGVPVGSYKAGRLANLGTGHWAVDGGAGYTYLDEKKGHEVSVVGGLTYNFENPDTDYKNGIDAHVDWAASQFFSPALHAGLVGYLYYQLTGDSGSGATLGDFKSRVYAIGPQLGYFFKMGQQKAYANVKAYYEFGAKNRPEGWNLWLSVAIPLGG